MSADSAAAVMQYHSATKHHFNRMARSLGYMDWENQPNPFRSYEGAAHTELPLGLDDPDQRYSMLCRIKNSQPYELNKETIGKFLELSVGLSAWKGHGHTRWALRMNPSSGNLHPTETHLLLPGIDPAFPAGIYHYAPLWHALEQRAAFSENLSKELEVHLGGGGFLVALSSIFWREAWKYGERALRYCLLDTGHALGALRFAANLLGWRMTLLTDFGQSSAEALFGFDRTEWPQFEPEHLEMVCRVHPAGQATADGALPEALSAALGGVPMVGRPEMLSRDHQLWPIIPATAAHLRREALSVSRPAVDFADKPCETRCEQSAAAIIRQRRSGLAFRADGVMDRNTFMVMLAKTLPRAQQAPFDIGFLAPEVHLLLFVHRVEGLEAGLYLLCRNRRDLVDLKGLMDRSFAWAPVEDALPLYRLQEGDVRQRAAEVSCRQAIAGESVFSLGMLARFDAVVRAAPWRYSELFWEAGLIGQVLYLEAEAHGYRGTGIGCFFDDAVHQWAGLDDEAFQSLYHFTVGVPIEDPRLKTHAPYAHLRSTRISP